MPLISSKLTLELGVFHEPLRPLSILVALIIETPTI
jgi:hypothetical protein